MKTVSLLDILLLCGIGQGVFLVFTISQIKDIHWRSNRYLVAILLCATWMLCGKLFAPRFMGDWVFRLALFTDAFIFLYGPLFYLYVQNIFKIKAYRVSVSFWHFVPVLCYLVYFIVTLFYPVQELRVLLYQKHMVIMIVTETLGLISLVGYLIASILIFRKEKLDGVYPPKYQRKIYFFVGSILLSLCCLTLLWLISFISIYYFKSPLGFFTYKSMWIITSISFYAVGFLTIRFPVALKLNTVAVKDRLGSEKVEELQQKLDKLIQEEAIYEQADLTLRMLAEKLEVSGNDLSWFLNAVLKKSFYDYINELRIDAFTSKVEKKEHVTRTLISLAFDVGFKSKSTFNKAFKEYKGVSPKEFIKSTDEKLAQSSLQKSHSQSDI